MTPKIIVRSLLGGALGAVTPYILFGLFGGAVLIPLLGTEAANGIVEGMGILMTLACLPTIFVGSVFGALLVWLVVKLEKPKWLFMRMEQSQGTRGIFIAAFVGGFLTGPILGMSFLAIWISSLQ